MNQVVVRIVVFSLLLPFWANSQTLTYTKTKGIIKRQVFVSKGKWVRYKTSAEFKRVHEEKFLGFASDSTLILSEDTLALSEFVFCSKRRYLLDNAIVAAGYGKIGFGTYSFFALAVSSAYGPPYVIMGLFLLGSGILAVPDYLYYRSLLSPKLEPKWRMEISW